MAVGEGRRSGPGGKAGILLLPVLVIAACQNDHGASRHAGAVVINEVECTGRDYIEVVNATAEAMDVAGWRLADDFTKQGHQYTLPSGTVLAPGDHVVFKQEKDLEAGFAFGIKCGQDTVYLLDGARAVVDEIKVGAVPAGSTFGRLPDATGEFAETCPTPGGENEPPASAAAVLFDPGVVNGIALDLPSDSMASLGAAPGIWTQATATLTAGGVVTGPVATGVRLDVGASSRPLGEKASFHLDADRFDASSRLLGLKSLFLDAMVEDPTAMRATLAFEVFRAAGLPAARTGYARVTVNGEDYGLYAVVEVYDDVWAAPRFDSTVHVYEGRADLLPESLDTAVEVVVGDREDVRDLQALASTVSDIADADWLEAVALRLDLDAFLRCWAAEGWVGQQDGYSMAAANYFLHADSAGVFTWVPRGLDGAFVAAPEAPVCGGSVLCARCLAIPACASRFAPALEAVDAAARALAPDARVTEIEAVVGPALATDPMAEFDAAAHAAGVATLRTFLAGRAASAGEAVPAP